MTQKEITVGLRDGLQARPVAVFVQIAGNFQSLVTIVYKDRKVNAKSIMGMMSLGLAPGETVTVVTDGPDEEDALKGIEEYLTAKE